MSIDTIIAAIETDIEGAAEAAWSVLRPKLTGLGATILGQCATAAGTMLQNGFSATSLAQAIASVMAALPEDVVAAEADVSAAVVAFFQQLQADVSGNAAAAPAASS